MKHTIQSTVLAAVRELDLDEAVQFEVAKFRRENPTSLVGVRLTVLDLDVRSGPDNALPRRGRMLVEVLQSELGGASGQAAEVFARGVALDAKVAKLLAPPVATSGSERPGGA